MILFMVQEIDPEEFEAKLRPMGNNGEDYTGEIEFKSPQGRVLHAYLWSLAYYQALLYKQNVSEHGNLTPKP